MIPVTAAFGGLAMFIAIFVVASTLGLSIQQREREIALLRAVAATPGQIRRVIAWEAAIVALVGSAAGIVTALLAVLAAGRRAARLRSRSPTRRWSRDCWDPGASSAGCSRSRARSRCSRSRP